MPSSTNVRLTVNGVNRTQRMFAAVRANVSLLAGQVKAAGLAAAAGVAAVAAGIRSSSQQFSVLGDRATQAGVAANELNGLVSGLNVAGAKGAGLETVADALARMTKATGATGMDGLRETLANIAALGDEGARVQELSRIFGRTFGPGMAALVRQGPDAARAAIDDMIASGPRLSNSLVAAGDAIADGMSVAWNEVKTGWNSAWVSIGQSLSDHFGRPSRQLWADFGAYVRFGVEFAIRYVAQFATAVFNVFANIRTLWDAVFGEQGLGGVVARWLLKAWNEVKAFGEGILARFVFLKDALAAIFTDDTLDAAWDRFFARMEKNRRELAEDNAAADAMFGDAGWDNIRQAFADAGVSLRVETADLWKGLADDLDRNASGVFDRLNDLNASLGDAADAAGGGSLGALRDAKAVLANSYDAFRIGRQGAGGSPTDRATMETAKSSATIAQNTTTMARIAQKTLSALQGAQPLAVIS